MINIFVILTFIFSVINLILLFIIYFSLEDFIFKTKQSFESILNKIYEEDYFND